MEKLDVTKMKKWVKTTAILGAAVVVLSGCSMDAGLIEQSVQKTVNQAVDKFKTSKTSAAPEKQHKKNHSKNSSKSQKQNQTNNGNNGKNNAAQKPLLGETVKVTASGKHVVTNPNSILVCADKHRNLPATYVPPDLVIPNIRWLYGKNAHYEKMHMRKVAAKPVEALFNAATSDGIILYGVSGYRSYKYQVAVFGANVKRYGSVQKANQVSAEPGQSEHQTGLSLDVSAASVNYQLIQKFGDTKAGKWLAANAWKYGFIIRYPKGKQSITGYEYEPWHIRYVGKKAAKVIHANHLTLEQYLSQ